MLSTLTWRYNIHKASYRCNSRAMKTVESLVLIVSNINLEQSRLKCILLWSPADQSHSSNMQSPNQLLVTPVERCGFTIAMSAWVSKMLGDALV